MKQARTFSPAWLAVALVLSGCISDQQVLPTTSPHRLAAISPTAAGRKVAFDRDPRDAGIVVASSDQGAKATAWFQAVRAGAIGRPVEWSNERTGNHGSIEILREVRIPESDRVCREYRETSMIDGLAAADVGQACQQHDGTWWNVHR